MGKAFPTFATLTFATLALATLALLPATLKFVRPCHPLDWLPLEDLLDFRLRVVVGDTLQSRLRHR